MAEENESLRNVFDKYMGMKLDEMRKVSSTADAYWVLKTFLSRAAHQEAANEVPTGAVLYGHPHLYCGDFLGPLPGS